MGKSSRAIAAHHEAGHAVIAHQLGCKVHRVAIDADSGRTVISRLGKGEKAILVNLAGPFAQKRFAPRSHWRSRSHTGWNSGADFDNITGLIFNIYGKGKVAEAYWRFMETRAEDLVERHWQLIAAVATYLLEHGVFTGDIRVLFSQPRRSV